MHGILRSLIHKAPTLDELSLLFSMKAMATAVHCQPNAYYSAGNHSCTAPLDNPAEAKACAFSADIEIAVPTNLPLCTRLPHTLGALVACVR